MAANILRNPKLLIFFLLVMAGLYYLLATNRTAAFNLPLECLKTYKMVTFPPLVPPANDSEEVEIPGLLIPKEKPPAPRKIITKDPKILCIIQTASQFHQTRLMSIWATWAKLCDDFFAATSVENETLHMVNMHVGDSKDFTWGKVMGAFHHIHTKKDWTKFDWFIKTDDDAYIVMENLRNFLRDKDPNHKVWYGARFHVGWDNHWTKYMSGPCYVISRAAFAAVMAGPINSNELCYANRKAGMEDVIIGRCMENAGVEFGDGRDPDGKFKFFPDKLELFLMPKARGGADENLWLYSYLKDRLATGTWKCCSNEPIMFHYITPKMMYIMHFVYRAYEHERYPMTPELIAAASGNPVQRSTTPAPLPLTTTTTTVNLKNTTSTSSTTAKSTTALISTTTTTTASSTSSKPKAES